MIDIVGGGTDITALSTSKVEKSINAKFPSGPIHYHNHSSAIVGRDSIDPCPVIVKAPSQGINKIYIISESLCLKNCQFCTPQNVIITTAQNTNFHRTVAV